MISLAGASWHPRRAPEVEINELDIVSTHLEEKGKYRPKLGTHLQKYLIE